MISGQPQEDKSKKDDDEGPEEAASTSSSSSDSDPNDVEGHEDEETPQHNAESKQAAQATSNDEEGKAQDVLGGSTADAGEEEPWCTWGIAKIPLSESTCFHHNVVDLDLDQEMVLSTTGMFCHKLGESWSILSEFQRWLTVWYFLNF